MKPSAMNHVTVTRILLIVVLGCAAVSVHLALQMKNECMFTNKSPQHVVDVYELRLNTTLFPSAYSSTPRDATHELHELSNIKRDYQKDVSHRSVEITTGAAVDRPGLKSTTVHMPSSFHGQSLPPLPATFDVECMLPLFCSSKVVRNCITNDIIGHIPNAIRSQQMKSPRSRSIETSHMRRLSFKKVFDSRAWGHDWDLHYRGLNASGA